MAENSKIEWCNHTFNPWIGCQKVSAACDFCYAEALMDTRLGRAKWGPGQARVRTSEANWKLPYKWDREAAKTGKQVRVFCASLADVFDNAVPGEWRADLWQVIDDTPNLIWLLLTKRPENIRKQVPFHEWQPNVWLGTTAEDQPNYNRRWPHLVGENCSRRFVSYEPALGPLDIGGFDVKPHWLICGGESGPYARPMHPQWARDIRDQCAGAGVAYFHKQNGEWIETDGPRCRRIWQDQHPTDSWMTLHGELHPRSQETNRRFGVYGTSIVRCVGKKTAGRLLDGREWNEMPT